MPRNRSARGTSAPAIRLHTPAQIVAAVPYLVGFHPTESVVVVGLGADPPRVCLTARVDLPPPDCSASLAQMLTAHLQHAGAGRVVPIVFTDEAGELPRRDLVDAIEGSAGEHGIEFVDALFVRGGRWWSYRCQLPTCCPPEGTAIDPSEVSELAAAAAYLGDVVHRSREELEQSLRPVGLPARAALDQAFDRVSHQFDDDWAEGRREALAAESRELLRAAVQLRTESSAELSSAEVARLALGLTDVLVRDDALMWAGTDLEHAAEALWVELLRKAAPPYDAPPATLLAAHAYLRGNGAYARIAVERALASDPGYSFALLLAEGLDRAVPPSALRAALTLTATPAHS